LPQTEEAETEILDHKMRVIIFANGEISSISEKLVKLIKTGDIIIAADGGAVHCMEMKIIPDLAIGDFDSLSSEILKKLQASGTSVMGFPAKKNQTDLELAMDHALSLGAKEIIIIGALGARWDMTFANVLLMAKAGFPGCFIRIIDDYTEIFIIKSGKQIELEGCYGDTVSLIPLGGDVFGVTTKGLEYPLDNETLFFSSPRGVSNLMLENKACVYIKQGILLCFLIHKRQS